MIEVRVPGDKSISHRSLMIGALADGITRVRDILTAADVRSTASVLRSLGATVPDLLASREIVVAGLGRRGFRSPDDVLDCGNSGTTSRLMMGVVAGSGVAATFTGDESLRGRPMRRITDPLQQMGARSFELGELGRLPIRIEGGDLRSIRYELPHASAQIKSAILLAAAANGIGVEVVERVRSRDHTERMLGAAGVPIRTEETGGRIVVSLSPADRIEALDVIVPGDFSSAAFFLAAPLVGACDAVRVPDVCLNKTRTGMLRVLEMMGADISIENERNVSGEPIGDVIARTSELRAVSIGEEIVPSMVDEIPMLAMLAARADGETTIRGAGELRVKETDRIRAVVENLRTVGVDADELEDGLVVQGTTRPLKGLVKTYADHRIAMCFAVLGAQPGNDIVVDDPGAVDISFPTFWASLERIRAAS
jgi:3-phosphoshikimate 1-carboxyvinyltransferase